MTTVDVGLPSQVTERAPAGAERPRPDGAVLYVAGAAFFGVVLSIPRSIALGGASASSFLNPVFLLVWVAIQASMCLLFAVIAMPAARAVGLAGSPLDGWGADPRDHTRIRSALKLSLLMGLACGLAILATGAFVPQPHVKTAMSLPGPGAELLASIGAGLYEEVVFRLLLMSLVVGLGAKLLRQAHPSRTVMWTGIVTAALVVGAAHLPQAHQFLTVTPVLVAHLLLANGIVGICCGWLFWRRGLVAAMVAHIAVDLVIHVLLATLRALA